MHISHRESLSAPGHTVTSSEYTIWYQASITANKRQNQFKPNQVPPLYGRIRPLWEYFSKPEPNPYSLRDGEGRRHSILYWNLILSFYFGKLNLQWMWHSGNKYFSAFTYIGSRGENQNILPDGMNPWSNVAFKKELHSSILWKVDN